MGYTLKSIMKIENKSLLECIDENFYKWSKIINKHTEWYEEEVLDYMNYIYGKIGKYKKEINYSHSFK